MRKANDKGGNLPGWQGSEADRVWSRIVILENGCWAWTGHTVKGYARMKLQGQRRTIGVHVWTYTTYVGPIPDGLELDHLCRLRRCVNPRHLEPVTGQVNNHRGTSPAAENVTKQFCNSGHPLSGDNLTVNNRGHRVCRTCDARYKATNRRKARK